MTSNRSRLAALAWTACLLAFVALALRAATGGALHLDVSIARRVQSLPNGVDPLFSFENWLGDGLPLICVTLAVAAVLALRRHSLEAGLVLLTFLARAGDVAVKEAVSEPRPSPSLIHVSFPHDNLSFPSGHAIGVSLVFGLLFAFAPHMLADRRAVVLLRSTCAFYIASIGLARIWVGAHWPTDVLGGYLYAALFLIPALLVVSNRLSLPQRREPARSD